MSNNEAPSLRYVDVKINKKYDIPDSYVPLFKRIYGIKKNLNEEEEEEEEKANDKSEYKITIKVSQIRNNTSTTISWDDDKTFNKNEVEELIEHIKKTGKCCFPIKTTKKGSALKFSGRMTTELKNYLVDEYKFKVENIKVIDIDLDIPKSKQKFSIDISLDDDNDDLASVEFAYKKWDCQMFRELLVRFEEVMAKEWNIIIDERIDHNKKYTMICKGDNFTEIFKKYFLNDCGLSNEQVKIERKLILSKKYSHQNTYKIMKGRFSKFDPTSYSRELSQTIIDTYAYEKRQLSKFVIHTDLFFKYVFTDDDNYNYYSIQLNVCNTFNIDGLKAGQGLSEGNVVIVRHKKSKALVVGHINTMKNGNIIVLFRLKPNQIPPGCGKKSLPKDQSDDINDYIQANFEDDNDYLTQFQCDDDDDVLFEDDDDDESNNQINYNSQYGQYIITFQPNKAIYRRSALSLLILDDIESPIKDLIMKNSDSINDSINKVSDEKVSDGSIDIPNFYLIPTPSQIDCLNNILQYNLSLIQGPPGCGKTTSIGFFVYHILKRNENRRKRILLCAYSNQAVENIVKAVSPIVKALGKKMVWIPKQSMRFETEDDFKNASEEEKYLSFYKILNDDKQGCKEFKQLCEKKWKFDIEMDRYSEAYNRNYAKDFSWDRNVEFFSEYDQNKMVKLQNQIEEKLVSESDVVCCTLLQSAKRSVVDFKFEYLFVDEATQVDQATSLIPLIHRPSKMILLGDHKQLDPFIPEEIKKRHPFSTQSLYSYLISKNIKSVMLRTQFRMNPLIAEFPNREFYDNQIINADGMDEKTAVKLEGITTPILFVDVKNGYERKVFGSSFKNDQEADVVMKLLHNFKMNCIPFSEVGVITPYYGQKDLLRNKASSLKYNGIRISSVDNFQGSERDYIIFSLVRSNRDGNFGFLANPNRINVSITRARKGLIIVGNFNETVNNENPKNKYLVDMCKFYREKKAVVDSSSIEEIKVRKPPVEPLKIEYRNKKKLDIEWVDD